MTVDKTYDPDENRGWWEKNWLSVLLIGVQLVAGLIMCCIPCMQGVGVSLLAGAAFGALSMLAAELSPGMSKVLSGFGTISSGVSAISTGISLFACGPVGWVAGAICLAVGVATVAFGLNEAVEGITGVNAIREATRISQEEYEMIYLGLNIASTVCTLAGQAIRGWKGCTCFIAGTLVLCMDEDGNQCHKPIEDVKVGDMVWAYDEETGENDWKPVVRLFRNQTKEWYHVFVNGEEIVCTGGHPFYVVGEGFVEARELKISDKVLLSDGTCAIIKEIQVEQLEKTETTYNFEVADFHTYYVAENNVLVHNDCKPNFDVIGFDDAAVAEAKAGDPSFSTFKKRLFAAQERLHPGTFDDASVMAKGLSPSINGEKIILHHPLGRVGGNLYNVVGVTQQQHLAIHHIIGYRNAKWDLVKYIIT